VRASVVLNYVNPRSAYLNMLRKLTVRNFCHEKQNVHEQSIRLSQGHHPSARVPCVTSCDMSRHSYNCAAKVVDDSRSNWQLSLNDLRARCDASNIEQDTISPTRLSCSLSIQRS
jgi:hypothetical protein